MSTAERPVLIHVSANGEQTADAIDQQAQDVERALCVLSQLVSRAFPQGHPRDEAAQEQYAAALHGLHIVGVVAGALSVLAESHRIGGDHVAH